MADLISKKAWTGGAGKVGGGVVGSVQLLRACAHWETLTVNVLRDAARQAEANRMKNMLLHGFTRVSYVAAPARALREVERAAAREAAGLLPEEPEPGGDGEEEEEAGIA